MIYRFGDCELDDQRYQLRRGGVPCHLEPQVFEVLAYLVRHRDRVVPRTELLDQIWGSRFVTDSALASRVKAARRAVGDNGREQGVIRTVHGRGYQFLAPVQEPAPEPGAPAPPVAAPAGVAPVGREAELGRLQELYGLTQGGRRQVVFVTGEAGIGKSTLVEAFAAGVERERAGLVARGQCLEQRGAPEPYLPVFDALDRLCRADPGAVAVLARVAPTWLVQMPALVEPGERDDLERRALGGTQERMLREAAEALESVAAGRPLVLLLEDLHWADPSTVDLLAWLARRPTPARLLVAGPTARPTPWPVAPRSATPAPTSGCVAWPPSSGWASSASPPSPPCWAATSRGPRSPRSWPGWCTAAPTGCRCSWCSWPGPGPTPGSCGRRGGAGSWPPVPAATASGSRTTSAACSSSSWSGWTRPT
jgi:DNA-binding winged helix-turn-helix (wHTH) protein